MAKDTLTTIVEVEKDIRVRLAAERKGAEERLAQVKREAEEEIRKEEERLEVALQQALAVARADAERKGTALVEDVAARAEHLARLDEKTLREIIARHLIRILPGRGDDRQNVQG